MLYFYRRAKNPASTSYILKLLFCTLQKAEEIVYSGFKFSNSISNIWTYLFYLLYFYWTQEKKSETK